MRNTISFAAQQKYKLSILPRHSLPSVYLFPKIVRVWDEDFPNVARHITSAIVGHCFKTKKTYDQIWKPDEIAVILPTVLSYIYKDEGTRLIKPFKLSSTWKLNYIVTKFIPGIIFYYEEIKAPEYNVLRNWIHTVIRWARYAGNFRIYNYNLNNWFS